MKTLLTVIVTAVVSVAIFLWISVFHPEWLVKLQYDSEGFPRIKKRGDRFVLVGQNYTYDGASWIKVDANWFPINPVEGDSFVVDGIGYKFTNGVWVKISGPNDTTNQTVSGPSDPTSSRNEELAILRGSPKIVNGTDWTWAVGLYYANGMSIIPGNSTRAEKEGKCLVPYDGDGDGSQDVYNGQPLWHWIKCNTAEFR